MTRASRSPIRFRGRSFLALVLAPEAPLAEWLKEIDGLIERSPGFFAGRAVVVDLSRLPLDKAELTSLIADLHARDIRIMGIEGAEPGAVGLGLPPLVSGGRAAGAIVAPDDGAPDAASAAPAPMPSGPPPPASLLIDSPVRSGQSVVFPDGDVTVIGSVGSGAEIIAGGSIHVYGTLRGRALAGSTGNPRARIFCHKLEAELLAIDGLYKMADDLERQHRGRPVQAWLDGDAILTAALD